MSEYDSQPLILAAEQFAKLPGIGLKTAQRLAYFILNSTNEEVEEFANGILEARRSVKICERCQNFSSGEICNICADDRRDKKVICVVDAPKDVTAFERSGGFNGVYHVLHGLLSPMDGIGPQQLKIKELMSRLTDCDEVIMATNPTVEGEATAVYLSRMIKPMGIKVTRLAYGLPAGSSLEYADDVTLQRALENRNEL
ncbi:MAG: recombination protein RecR [Eubacterium sp.]|nr:recombination protein RecR [Eubacterium sp.]